MLRNKHLINEQLQKKGLTPWSQKKYSTSTQYLHPRVLASIRMDFLQQRFKKEHIVNKLVHNYTVED